MFDTLKPAAPDAILMLMGLYRDDPRSDKVDLGVGVYKDAEGHTPVMRAVREAERRLHEEQNTKAYVGLAGDVGFNAKMTELVFGAGADTSRLRAAQAPGGSGAIRMLAELIKITGTGATVWVPDPTWPNHMPLMRSATLKTATYPYFDPATSEIRFDAMIEALKALPGGDIVLLHGCCHNPTGADLSSDQWKVVAEVLTDRGLIPFIDIAYQGFGNGLDEDAAGLRILAERVPELMAAASCSKNFSVYRDRAGIAFVLGRNTAEADIAHGQLQGAGRTLWSMPPDHGAACVRIVLEDEVLAADWRAELEATRLRMLELRQGLADALRRKSNSERFDFIGRQCGMFSRFGLNAEQVKRLREEHAVYIVGDSRFNVAGLPGDRLDELAAKIVAVL
ncbi:amino acid aminotransferase [Aminobacter sp. J44]|uniref:amino acid aminotransferase n=1 Tax=Aminobacter sp. J44 TaxID=935262 RepID=UPI00119BE32F|nr:amino acid aminotransferase [Aminobacter sp. J44]TWG61353.1 aromatic-amino-acid transaminase [Aminobacter sp. J44]